MMELGSGTADESDDAKVDAEAGPTENSSLKRLKSFKSTIQSLVNSPFVLKAWGPDSQLDYLTRQRERWPIPELPRKATVQYTLQKSFYFFYFALEHPLLKGVTKM